MKIKKHPRKHKVFKGVFCYLITIPWFLKNVRKPSSSPIEKPSFLKVYAKEPFVGVNSDIVGSEVESAANDVDSDAKSGYNSVRGEENVDNQGNARESTGES